MTCIVALKGKNNDWIVGSDSYSCGGIYGEVFNGSANIKTLRYFDDPKLVLAHTGTTRFNTIISNTSGLTSDLVKYENELLNSNEKPKKPIIFNFDYVLRNFIPRINNALKPFKFENKNNIKTVVTTYIVARDDKAFLVTSEGLIYELVDFCAKGSGKNGAIGYYFTNVTEKDPTKILLNCLVCGIKSSAGCKFPIRITSTKSDKFYVLKEKEVYEILAGKKEFEL